MRLSLAVPNTLSVINSIPCIETSTNLSFFLDLIFILINIDIKKSSVERWVFFSSSQYALIIHECVATSKNVMSDSQNEKRKNIVIAF